MIRTRRETLAAIAGFVGVTAGCTDDEAGGSAIDAWTGLADEVIQDVQNEAGRPDDVTVDLTDLTVEWSAVEEEVGAILVSVETEYGTLAELADDGAWGTTASESTLGAGQEPSLFEETDAGPDDFTVANGSEEFALGLSLFTELRDHDGEELSGAAVDETVYVRVENVDSDGDGQESEDDDGDDTDDSDEDGDDEAEEGDEEEEEGDDEEEDEDGDDEEEEEEDEEDDDDGDEEEEEEGDEEDGDDEEEEEEDEEEDEDGDDDEEDDDEDDDADSSGVPGRGRGRGPPDDD